MRKRIMNYCMVGATITMVLVVGYLLLTPTFLLVVWRRYLLMSIVGVIWVCVLALWLKGEDK